MPVSANPVAPDHLLHSVIGSGAAEADERGIALDLLVDKRLPDRIEADPTALFQLGRRLLSWALSVPGAQSVAVALWHGGAEGPLPRTMCLEVSAFGPVRRPCHDPDLTELVAQMSGRAMMPRLRNGAVAASVELPLMPARLAQPALRRHDGLFHQLQVLYVGDLVFDAARAVEAMGAFGIALAVTADADEAQVLTRNAVAAARPFEIALISSVRFGMAGAAALARVLRERSGPHRLRVVLTGMPETEITPGATDFDVIARRTMPPRGLDEVLADLVRPDRNIAATGDPRTTIPDLRGRRVLIAEDVRTNQMMLRAMLEPTGAELDVATNGAEAVAMHRAAPYDLVLMDIQMPQMDGLEATRALRALGGPVAIIALTANAKSSDRALYLTAGMDDYLAKPIRIAELYAVVARYRRTAD